MSELAIRHTNVFSRNYEALSNPSQRFVVNVGGTRSSKTYSLCQMFIVYALQNPNKIISIVRKTFPALRSSVMRDFFEIMKELNLYDEKYHNKTENIYTFPNGSIIEFFSLDDAQKIRGRKRHLLWANESNELTFEDFNQLNFRTEDKLFFDFNPSDTEHWLYDVLERPDAVKIHSTYKDNSFLPTSLIKEIEELIKVDQDYYNIYALGLPSKSTHTVYNHHKFYLDKPECKETLIGLDFGFTHPTAMIRCDFRENEVYVKELIYESYLTTPELITKVKDKLAAEGLPINTTIVCDYARPEIIAELNSAGLNCVNAIKNVKEGIDAVKSKILMVDDLSLNIKKELANYKWKSQGERLLDEVIKLYDDAMDAMRYAVLYHKKNYGGGGGYDFTFISY
jgi:phage terminase large subunit